MKSCLARQVTTLETFIPSVSAPFHAPVPRLHKIFAEFGVPAQVRTDNGPPFNGKELKSFAKSAGFDHQKITPKWPQANGEVERFMCTVKKTIEAVIVEHRPCKHELHDMRPHIHQQASHQPQCYSTDQCTSKFPTYPVLQETQYPLSTMTSSLKDLC